MIDPYPKHDSVDRVLENLGDDFYHDHIHRLHGENMPAVAAGASDSASSDADSNDEREDFSAVAVASDDLPAVAAMEAGAP